MTSNICIVWLPQKIGNLMTFVVPGYIAWNFSICDPSESGSGSLNLTPTFQFSLRKVGGWTNPCSWKIMHFAMVSSTIAKFRGENETKIVRTTTLVYNCIITWNSAKWSPNFWAQLLIFVGEGGPKFAQDQAAFSR